MPAVDSQLSTRDQILHTAEALFSAKGIDAVSLNEINKAAGQKNTSSLHYHFGNKAGLIQSIVYSHYEEIENKLQVSLDSLENKGFFSCAELVETVTQPFMDKLDSQRGVHYLLIVTQLLNRSAEMVVEGHPQQTDKARLRVFELFDRVAGDLPDDIKLTRIVLFSSLLFHSLASFAQFEKSGQGNPLGDKMHFCNSLHDVLEAMVTAPVNR